MWLIEGCWAAWPASFPALLEISGYGKASFHKAVLQVQLTQNSILKKPFLYLVTFKPGNEKNSMLLKKKNDMQQNKSVCVLLEFQLLFPLLLSLTTVFTLYRSWSHFWRLRLSSFPVLTFGKLPDQYPPGFLSDTLTLPRKRNSPSLSYTISFPATALARFYFSASPSHLHRVFGGKPSVLWTPPILHYFQALQPC